MEAISQSYCVFPEDLSHRSFYGFLSAQKQEFRFRLVRPAGNAPTLENSILECDTVLTEILEGHEKTLHQRLSRCKTVDEFMVEFSDFVNKLVVKIEKPFTAPASYYQHLTNELDQIGWNSIRFIDKDLSQIHVEILDPKSRSHILHVKFPQEYPRSAPTLLAALPESFEFKWLPSSSLRLIIDAFREKLDEYQGFWDMMDELDQNTWVLEPENPDRSATSRLNNCSIQIEISPKSPYAYPEFRFLGADRVVVPLREKLNQSMETWDVSSTVKQNLESILEISFPLKTTEIIAEISLECGICYSQKLESDFPDISCENSSCSKQYHSSCLYDWLKALPTSRQSFDKIFGACPYCSSAIGCKVVNK